MIKKPCGKMTIEIETGSGSEKTKTVIGFAANVALICQLTADQGADSFANAAFARKQIHYMLGDTGRSFVVGFGRNYPLFPHHRASSCAGRGHVYCLKLIYHFFFDPCGNAHAELANRMLNYHPRTVCCWAPSNIF